METKSTELVKVDRTEYDVDESGECKVAQAFAPMIAKRDELAKEYAIVLSGGLAEDNLPKAKALAKSLQQVRKGIELTHKTQKAMALAFGRYVDAWKNAETEPVLQMEAEVKKITQHHVLAEKARLEKLLADRLEMCEPIDRMAKCMRLEEMSEEEFAEYYDRCVLANEAQVARDKKIEEERIAKEKAEQEERERVAKENARLKAEAEERDKKESAERAEREAVEKKRVAAEEKRAKEEADRLSKIEAEREKERKAAEEKLAAERAKTAKIEADAKAKADAEAKEKADAIAREKDTANKKSVHNDALKSIVNSVDGVTEDQAKAIVTAIAKGEISNVSIRY